ncbi:hypothetical protein [Dialister sp. i34-0019-2H8]|uniref:hypothetical protein n=1 Tax=Dialister sp. i34-0019-2H8 TaxID=3141190 RepID=UPI0036F24046
MTITGKEMNHGEKSPQVYVKPEGITSIVSLISTYRDAGRPLKAGFRISSVGLY